VKNKVFGIYWKSGIVIGIAIFFFLIFMNGLARNNLTLGEYTRAFLGFNPLQWFDFLFMYFRYPVTGIADTGSCWDFIWYICYLFFVGGAIGLVIRYFRDRYLLHKKGVEHVQAAVKSKHVWMGLGGLLIFLLVVNLPQFFHYRERQLLDAVSKNDYKEIEQCINRGADINYSNFEFGTVLTYAVVNSDMKTVELLLKLGANPNIPMPYSAYLGTPLTAACRNNDINRVKLLIDKGADPNIPWDDTTPLFWAVSSKNSQMVMLLLDKNADVNKVNQHEENALWWFGDVRDHNKKNDMIIIIKAIASRGINLNARDMMGDTLLEMVIRNKYPHEVIDLLKSLGAKTRKELESADSAKAK